MGNYRNSLSFYCLSGGCRFSQGDPGTDKLFTGQRLDDTSLYYYGARYYDPMIGRFISPDTTIPDGYNPQSYNRYSYCINNPTSAIDPSGLDYIFVCGSGADRSVWDPLIKALNIDTSKEKIRYVDDTLFGFPFEIQDQVQGLTNLLTTGGLTDIKIIGHSEGAAATALVLDTLAKNNGFIGETDVGSELTAAFLLDAPTGIGDMFVKPGFFDINSAYNNLPRDIHNVASMQNVILADIWNTASLVHAPYTMPGWTGYSYPYDSRSWWDTILTAPIFPWYLPAQGIGTIASYHNDPRTSEHTLKIIQQYIGY
jgi:RHS repeat-associated protein